MSLLPGQILPQSIPIGKVNVDGNGNVIIDKNWWLFLYNLALGTLSPTPGGTAVSDMEKILLNEIDSRVSDTTGGGGGGSGTVTTFSFTNANGFTGTVTNASTTPNLTLSSSFMVNPMTTQGDIIYEDATPTPNRLGIGTVNYGILAIAGLPQWEPVYSPLTPQPYDWGKTYMAVMNRVLQ